jgi:hypothetical protein
MKAGSTHTLAIIRPTVRFVM